MTRSSKQTGHTEGSAGFSRCGHYRYWLRRRWDRTLPQCAVIGLNPSTADARIDDPTLRRCIGFATRWGYGSLLLVNLFAWRATDPRELAEATEPVGAQTNQWLWRASEKSALVLAAWGNGEQCITVVARWPRQASLHCLGTTSLGMPRHPLYCRADITPRPFIISPN